MPNPVIYEQPLNERTRSLLRLEHLFLKCDHALRGTSVWDSRDALIGLLDIMAIFSRTDLKGEIMKELERHIASLSRIPSGPNVDSQRLSAILEKLGNLTDKLYAQKGQTGSSLRKNEFLKSIQQRTSIPGGTCDFDLPAFHFWLEQPTEQRHQQLREWLDSFTLIREAVLLILELIRGSGLPSHEQAQAGFFQQTLDSATPCQLIRVTLPENSRYYAEISGGKHRFTVRFLEPQGRERACQTEENVSFELYRCII